MLVQFLSLLYTNHSLLSFCLILIPMQVILYAFALPHRHTLHLSSHCSRIYTPSTPCFISYPLVTCRTCFFILLVLTVYSLWSCSCLFLWAHPYTGMLRLRPQSVLVCGEKKLHYIRNENHSSELSLRGNDLTCILCIFSPSADFFPARNTLLCLNSIQVLYSATFCSISIIIFCLSTVLLELFLAASANSIYRQYIQKFPKIYSISLMNYFTKTLNGKSYHLFSRKYFL